MLSECAFRIPSLHFFARFSANAEIKPEISFAGSVSTIPSIRNFIEVSANFGRNSAFSSAFRASGGSNAAAAIRSGSKSALTAPQIRTQEAASSSAICPRKTSFFSENALKIGEIGSRSPFAFRFPLRLSGFSIPCFVSRTIEKAALRSDGLRTKSGSNFRIKTKGSRISSKRRPIRSVSRASEPCCAKAAQSLIGASKSRMKETAAIAIVAHRGMSKL